MNGKGDRPRNNHSEQYRRNYDAIFRKEAKTNFNQPSSRDVLGSCETPAPRVRVSGQAERNL